MISKFDDIEDTLRERHNYSGYEISQIMPKLEEIDELRKQKNAIILAHYYQIPPIQLIADVRGDSLKLAESARDIKDKDLVVSSTVVFMAEMAKLLSPEKKVVVPSLEAGCSIAEGINGESVRRIRKEFPGSSIVSYINTYADTKAEVDSIFTSSNAKEVINNIEGNTVIIIPDHFFAKNIVHELRKGRRYISYKRKRGNDLIMEDLSEGKEIYVKGDGLSLPVLDKGTCVVHERFNADEVKYLKRKENAIVMAHPEVNPEVAAVSDFVGGTGKMMDYVRKSDAKKFIVITECDLTAPLREAYPDRDFITPCFLCPYMKKNSLDSVIKSLKEEVYEIRLDEKTSERARKSLERMFELSRRAA